MRTRYITTDLDLEGPDDLSEIAHQLDRDLAVHFCGQVGRVFRATFGLLQRTSDESSDIDFLCELAEALDPAARALWDRCSRIEFNIGYEAGSEPRSWRSRILTETLAQVSRLGGDLVVTIYSGELDRSTAAGDS
ncbi:MAG: hypothetical protein AAGC60_18295 [Acidobacteriota bacterium]